MSTRPRALLPRKVVALGGGTGLPAVLRGFKGLKSNGSDSSLTAIVTMSDDGGSSGRLRNGMGVPPPGDVRNCLVALSQDDQEPLAGLFQHRYNTFDELNGHSVGNLILAALAEQTGCFLKAVEVSSAFLKTVGRILPATDQNVTLQAELVDGTRISGESRIAGSAVGVRRISLSPADAPSTPGVIESILEADLVVIGPGSLFTSVVPNLVVRGVGKAIHESRAAVVMVANLVSERGEASGLELPDHVGVIEQHVGYPILDAILTNESHIEPETLNRYRAEGARPLYWPDRTAHQIHVARRELLASTPKLRHDPERTAAGLIEVWRELSARQAMDQVS